MLSRVRAELRPRVFYPASATACDEVTPASSQLVEDKGTLLIVGSTCRVDLRGGVRSSVLFRRLCLSELAIYAVCVAAQIGVADG
jgi:hypothetical protein